MSGETDQVKWRGVRPVEGIRGIWPARNATRVNASDWQDGAGTKVVYTVPAGKILFLSSMFLCSRYTGATQPAIHAYVRDDDDEMQQRLVSHYFAGAGFQTSGMWYMPAQEAQAGWDVCIQVSSADAAGRLIVAGWLEDA